MTTLTVDIPDELAAKLAPLQHQLPHLLSVAAELFSAGALENSTYDVVKPIFTEILDFLISGPSPERIIAFKISASAQTRLEYLLDKNRETGLTSIENAELDAFEQINHLMMLLKAHARASIVSTN